MSAARRFGSLEARAPRAGDAGFLFALYLAARPDLGALPVPRAVIDGIARHQQALQAADYAARYPRAETWLIEGDGGPVARLVLDRDADRVRVVDLAVAMEARRRGIGASLLAALQQECGGTHALVLRVRNDNAAARALYARMGFILLRDDGAAQELVWRRGPQGLAAQNE